MNNDDNKKLLENGNENEPIKFTNTEKGADGKDVVKNYTVNRDTGVVRGPDITGHDHHLGAVDVSRLKKEETPPKKPKSFWENIKEFASEYTFLFCLLFLLLLPAILIKSLWEGRTYKKDCQKNDITNQGIRNHNEKELITLAKDCIYKQEQAAAKEAEKAAKLGNTNALTEANAALKKKADYYEKEYEEIGKMYKQIYPIKDDFEKLKESYNSLKESNAAQSKKNNEILADLKTQNDKLADFKKQNDKLAEENTQLKNNNQNNHFQSPYYVHPNSHFNNSHLGPQIYPLNGTQSQHTLQVGSNTNLNNNANNTKNFDPNIINNTITYLQQQMQQQQQLLNQLTR